MIFSWRNRVCVLVLGIHGTPVGLTAMGRHKVTQPRQHLCPIPRYASLKLAGLHEVDYRTKTFSCSRCGAAAYLCLMEPTKETGMEDYRLDEQSEPKRHPAAVKRLTQPVRRAERPTHGELPGRSLKGRR